MPKLLRFWLEPIQWTLDRLLAALTFALVLILAACMEFKSDTWWLLRTGQEIVASRQIITTETFSWTHAGRYWPNHEWLTEVLFYGAYRLGGLPLLVAGCAVVVTLTWYLVARICAGPPRVRALTVLLGVVVSANTWSVRPQIISLLLFATTLWLLDQRRRHWLYVPLFLGWANLHAGVFAGLIVIVVAALGAAVRFRAEAVHWFSLALVCAAATLLNPLGWRLWQYTFGSLSSDARRYLLEWQPPSLGNPQHYPFFILIILTVVSVWRSRRLWHKQRDWTLLVAALVFLLLSVRSARHSAFFVVVAIPLLSRQFGAWALLPLAPRKTGVINQAIVGFLLVVGALLINQVWAQRPPVWTAAYQTALAGCTEPLFNSYDIGGELIWFAPEHPVFIDNRQDPYPDAFVVQVAVAEGGGDYMRLFDQYTIGCAVLAPDKPLYANLRRNGWRELHRDPALVVLQKP